MNYPLKTTLMKKTIFLIMSLMIGTFASAQLNFGLKAGYLSSLSLKNAADVTNGTYNFVDVKNELWNNFHAGAFARVNIKKLYIQPEVLYSIQKKDYQITFQDAVNNDVTLNKFVNISTVDIPILIGYKVFDFKMANVRAFLGPKISLNAGSTLEFENVTGGNFDVSQLNKEIKDSQVGLVVGAGVDVFMLTVDARLSLLDNFDYTKLSDMELPKAPSSTFVLSVGWKLF